MKVLFYFVYIVIVIVVLWSCGGQSDPKPTSSKITYQDIHSLMITKCTPCHFPSAGGFEKPMSTYTQTKPEIDEILRRINLDPTDLQSMPYEQFRTLSDDQKKMFQKWKDDGLLEK